MSCEERKHQTLLCKQKVTRLKCENAFEKRAQCGKENICINLKIIQGVKKMYKDKGCVSYENGNQTSKEHVQ